MDMRSHREKQKAERISRSLSGSGSESESLSILLKAALEDAGFSNVVRNSASKDVSFLAGWVCKLRIHILHGKPYSKDEISEIRIRVGPKGEGYKISDTNDMKDPSFNFDKIIAKVRAAEGHLSCLGGVIDRA